MSKTNEFEIHKVCRTCLSSGILKPLYDNYSTQECFGQMLMVCTEVQCDESDGLPRQICNKCIIELNRCYKFALKCRQSDNTLRSYIEKLIPEQYGQEYNADADPLDISVLHKELDLETFMIKQETDIDASSEADQFRTDSYQPEQANISNSTMATTMSSLLLQWGLPNLVADFEEQEIDESCLCDLSEELIKELIPKIGPRTRFMKHHKSYQSQLSNKPNVVAPALNPRYNTVLEIPKDSAAVNMIVPTTPQESSCSEPREFKRMCREINHFDIKAFLLTSSAGKFILNEYDAKKQLSRKSRNLLVDSLINGLMSDSDNKFLNNDDFRILGEKICELFSTEVLSTYYFPLVSCKIDPHGKSPTAKGKLVDKYRNVCRYYSNSLSGSNEEDSNTLPISEDNTVKRKDASDVWKHFTKKTDDINIAICKYCACHISRGGKKGSHKGYTTSNMWAHVKRFHLAEVNKVTKWEEDLTSISETLTQSTIPKLFSNVVYAINHPRAKVITQLIAEEICLDMEPLDHVNKEGFQRLMKKICPKYVMVSRAHIAQTILPNMYTRVKAKVQSELKHIPYISVTADLWTDASSPTNDFISVTAHGVSNEFEVKQFHLDVLPIKGGCEDIAHNLNIALLEWGITDKLQAITTDNARHIVNSVKELGFEHIPCMVDTVQLVLHNALLEQKKVKDMVKTARKIVGHFSHSVAMKELQVAQKTYNVPEHVLIQDVPTRWDTTYYMLRRLYEQRSAIQIVLPKFNSQDDLNTQQWIMMEQVLNILTYFEDVSSTLSNDRAMLSDVIPLVSSLFKILDRIKSDGHEDVKIIAEDLSKQLSIRYGKIEDNNSYIMATALDPRYKTRVFRVHSTAGKVKKLLYFTLGVGESSKQQAGTSASTAAPSGIWGICQEIIDDTEVDEPLLNCVVNTAKAEIDAYLKSPNTTHTSDPILYWKENLNYPRLQKLALKYLSYKPTSVSSSTTGLKQSNKGNRLSPNHLKTLCFLNKNLPVVNFEY